MATPLYKDNRNKIPLSCRRSRRITGTCIDLPVSSPVSAPLTWCCVLRPASLPGSPSRNGTRPRRSPSARTAVCISGSPCPASSKSPGRSSNTGLPLRCSNHGAPRCDPGGNPEDGNPLPIAPPIAPLKKHLILRFGGTSFGGPGRLQSVPQRGNRLCDGVGLTAL